jgi:hypothetical protein
MEFDEIVLPDRTAISSTTVHFADDYVVCCLTEERMDGEETEQGTTHEGSHDIPSGYRAEIRK